MVTFESFESFESFGTFAFADDALDLTRFFRRVAPGGASPLRPAGASPVTNALGAEDGVGKPGDRTRTASSRVALVQV